MFEKYAYKWLEAALDNGIKEWEYWDMTLAEVIRATESRQRVLKMEAQERAAMDYILADLIGRSMARIYSSSANLPKLYEAYPALFDAQAVEDKEQEAKDNISAIRFRQFADTFNKNRRCKGE